MCTQKIEEDEVCINTECSKHMCWKELRIHNANLHTTIGWVFQNCTVNLKVLGTQSNHEHNFITLRDIATMWNISFERVRQIEEEGLKHFANNLKSLEGGI